MVDKSVREIIDTDYREFSEYVLEQRAIPSVVDGLKPVQRKILYAMLEEHKGKKTKVADLGAISKFGYHHGENSAMQAAIGMAAAWQNIAPLFLEDGNFGSRLVQEAAAPRYIFTSLDRKVWDTYFTDHEVVDRRLDPDHPEPQCYLPNIPWVMVNGTSGIAVGFASSFLPHHPRDIADACLSYIKGNLPLNVDIQPTFPGFVGLVEKNKDGKWTTKGLIERTKRNVWTIRELPFGYDREAYYNILCKLEDDGHIQEFEDACDDSGFKFVIKVDSKKDADMQAGKIDFLKLTKVHSENLTALDEHGKLKVFSSHYDIIKHFCDFRIGKIDQKIKYDISVIEERIKKSDLKMKFINAVLDGTIVYRDKKRSELVDNIKQTLSCTEEEATKLTSIPIYALTRDAILELEDDIKGGRAEIERLNSSVPKNMFMSRLKTLSR